MVTYKFIGSLQCLSRFCLPNGRLMVALKLLHAIPSVRMSSTFSFLLKMLVENQPMGNFLSMSFLGIHPLTHVKAWRLMSPLQVITTYWMLAHSYIKTFDPWEGAMLAHLCYPTLSMRSNSQCMTPKTFILHQSPTPWHTHVPWGDLHTPYSPKVVEILTPYASPKVYYKQSSIYHFCIWIWQEVTR